METTSIRAADGDCPTHICRPAGKGPWPAVILYMDGLGMGPAMFEIGERIAAEGYFVLLPDLFYRAGAYDRADAKVLFSDPDARQKWFGKISQHASPAQIERDIPAFFEFLDAQADVVRGPIGITGYCMGGRLAVITAAKHPDRIAACGAFHPGGLVSDAPDSPHKLVGSIKAKCHIAGAMEDQSFTVEQRETFAKALAEAGVTAEVIEYPAKHGWVPTDTPVYDAAQAERHYRALFELFSSTLT